MNSQTTPRQAINEEAFQTGVANAEPLLLTEDDLPDGVSDEEFMTFGSPRVITPCSQAGPEEFDYVYLWFYS